MIGWSIHPSAKKEHDEILLHFAGIDEGLAAAFDLCYREYRHLICINPKLYNLRTDIGETNDVADANPDIVAKLQALIAASKDDLGVDGISPGCRELGRVENPKPLIPHDAE